MKNFSTAALSLVFAVACANAHSAANCEFLSNAPDAHTVVRGDTLWGISGKFLQNPWCWPQVWGMNKEEIRNPHWIYPGQTVYFDRASGRLRLGTPPGAAASDEGTTRLSPQMRVEGLGQAAVPAIPASKIEPFLSQPLVIESDALQYAPHIVAAAEGRVNLSKNDKVYVSGDLQNKTAFQVFRPGTPLRDPDTRAVIGYEAVYLGNVKLQRSAQVANEAHTFTVVNSKLEMGVGDRLLPVPPTPLLNYVPHPPENPVAARIVSIYGGVTHAGQSQIVAINRGKNDGIDLGTSLELSRLGSVVVDRQTKAAVKLPNEKYGSLFIFRVFNNISYGLIMQVTDTVQVGDLARSPE